MEVNFYDQIKNIKTKTSTLKYKKFIKTLRRHYPQGFIEYCNIEYKLYEN